MAEPTYVTHWTDYKVWSAWDQHTWPSEQTTKFEVYGTSVSGLVTDYIVWIACDKRKSLIDFKVWRSKHTVTSSFLMIFLIKSANFLLSYIVRLGLVQKASSRLCFSFVFNFWSAWDQRAWLSEQSANVGDLVGRPPWHSNCMEHNVWSAWGQASVREQSSVWAACADPFPALRCGDGWLESGAAGSWHNCVVPRARIFSAHQQNTSSWRALHIPF